MLGKSTKDDVARMFQHFGPIEDLTMLHDKDGNSKKCAFIKFASRQQAQKAINEMHGSEIMPVSYTNQCSLVCTSLIQNVSKNHCKLYMLGPRCKCMHVHVCYYFAD